MGLVFYDDLKHWGLSLHLVVVITSFDLKHWLFEALVAISFDLKSHLTKFISFDWHNLL